MEGGTLSLDSSEASAKAEELVIERPVQYRLYKRRFAGLVALVSKVLHLNPSLTSADFFKYYRWHVMGMVWPYIQ